MLHKIALTNKHPRGSGIMGKWMGTFFTLIFSIFGVVLVLVGTGNLAQDLVEDNVPPFVILIFGAFIVLTALYIGYLTIKNISLELKSKRYVPDEPWINDYNWSRKGVNDELAGKIRKYLFGAILVGTFLAGFNITFLFLDKDAEVHSESSIGFASIETESSNNMWVAYVVIGVFDTMFILQLGYIFYLILRKIKYGKTSIRFLDFPFFRGDTLDVKFKGGRALKNVKQIKVELRCIMEEIVVNYNRNRKSVSQICFEVYNKQKMYESDINGDAFITFDIPEDEQQTHISRPQPVYWELTISADVPGIDYCNTFLVPVY